MAASWCCAHYWCFFFSRCVSCVLLLQWAALEGGCRALAFTSGMAALSVATKLVSTGGHIVAGDDIYGGTSRLLSQVVPARGVTVSNVDMTDIK